MFQIVDEYVQNALKSSSKINDSNGIFIGVPHNDIDFHIHLGDAILQKLIVIGIFSFILVFINCRLDKFFVEIPPKVWEGQLEIFRAYSPSLLHEMKRSAINNEYSPALFPLLCCYFR